MKFWERIDALDGPGYHTRGQALGEPNLAGTDWRGSVRPSGDIELLFFDGPVNS